MSFGVRIVPHNPHRTAGDRDSKPITIDRSSFTFAAKTNGEATNPFAERKRREAAFMGAVATAGIYAVRIGYEPIWQLGIESAAVAALLLFGVACWLPMASNLRDQPKRLNQGRRHTVICFTLSMLAISVPVISRLVLNPSGTAPAWEMVWLTSFGVAAISLALFAWRDRDVGLSVIASGFLVLFAAATADTPLAVWLAIAWAMICLWWLVANHWERLDQCMSDSVRRMPGLRVGSTVSGFILAAVTALIAWGQFGGSTRLSWGLMPTSGGDLYSDGTARSGVGDGEAIVAAQEHAASFGAVDSDIFLDSDQPSLFDMFDDTIGEPFRPKQFNRAIALQQKEVLDSKDKPGESGSGGASFPIARQKVKKPAEARSDDSDVILRWIGDSGAHLAMERFTNFDGKTWKAVESVQHASLDRKELNDRIWFFVRRDMESKFYRRTEQQAVKVMRLESARIPSPAAVAGVSIKDVDRSDFFGLASDGSLIMPGRKTIPRQTNIRLVSWSVNESAVVSVEQFPDALTHNADIPDGEKPSEQLAGVISFVESARSLCAGEQRNWETAKKIIEYLRAEYEFDRETDCGTDDPLQRFFQQRRGGDHMFATAASVMLRALGYETRLTTGFYANPLHYNMADGETEIFSEDAHVWLEVHVGGDLWLPLEPTPGYAEPRLNRTFLHKLAALCWWAAPTAAICAAVAWVIWLWRGFLGEQLCMLIWYGSRFFSPRHRLRVWSRILDFRCTLAHRPRPSGVAQRRWIKQLCTSNTELALKIDSCFDELDAIVYGDRPLHKGYLGGRPDELIRQLNVSFIIKSQR